MNAPHFAGARGVALALMLGLAAAAGATPGAAPAQEAPLREALAQFDAGRYDDARAKLTAYARANPKSAEAAFYLGRVALVGGDFDEAAHRFETAVRLEPKRSAYHAYLGRAYGQQALRGSKLKGLFLARKIRGELETAIALDPDNAEARMDLVGFLVNAPGVAGGSVEDGMRQARDLAARDPYHGHVALALALEKRRDAAGAEREYRAAMALHPDSASAPYALGLLYQRTNQTEKAFAAFEELLRAHPDATAALYAIGRLAAQTGQRLDRGEAALRQYLDAPLREGNPPPASAHYRLGAIYERTGRKALARAEYEASLRLEDRAEVREALGRVR